MIVSIFLSYTSLLFLIPAFLSLMFRNNMMAILCFVLTYFSFQNWVKYKPNSVRRILDVIYVRSLVTFSVIVALYCNLNPYLHFIFITLGFIYSVELILEKKVCPDSVIYGVHILVHIISCLYLCFYSRELANTRCSPIEDFHKFITSLYQ
jgi:hypothetical protein